MENNEQLIAEEEAKSMIKMLEEVDRCVRRKVYDDLVFKHDVDYVKAMEITGVKEGRFPWKDD